MPSSPCPERWDAAALEELGRSSNQAPSANAVGITSVYDRGAKALVELLSREEGASVKTLDLRGTDLSLDFFLNLCSAIISCAAPPAGTSTVASEGVASATMVRRRARRRQLLASTIPPEPCWVDLNSQFQPWFPDFQKAFDDRGIRYCVPTRCSRRHCLYGKPLHFNVHIARQNGQAVEQVSVPVPEPEQPLTEVMPGALTKPKPPDAPVPVAAPAPSSINPVVSKAILSLSNIVNNEPNRRLASSATFAEKLQKKSPGPVATSPSPQIGMPRSREPVEAKKPTPAASVTTVQKAPIHPKVGKDQSIPLPAKSAFCPPPKPVPLLAPLPPPPAKAPSKSASLVAPPRAPASSSPLGDISASVPDFYEHRSAFPARARTAGPAGQLMQVSAFEELEIIASSPLVFFANGCAQVQRQGPSGAMMGWVEAPNLVTGLLEERTFNLLTGVIASSAYRSSEAADADCSLQSLLDFVDRLVERWQGKVVDRERCRAFVQGFVGGPQRVRNVSFQGLLISLHDPAVRLQAGVIMPGDAQPP